MSAHCSDPRCSICAGIPAAHVEVRDGRRYENSRDVGPAQPDTALTPRQHDSSTKGGRATRGGPRRKR